MPDVINRDDREKKLLAILLLIMVTDDIDEWLRGGRDRRWFRRQVSNSGVVEFGEDLAESATREMLKELDFEPHRILLRGATDQGVELSNRIADSLHRSSENWIEDYFRRRGEGVPNGDMPEIYPQWKAKRDSITNITVGNSMAELATRRDLRSHFDVELLGQWKLDPRSNWCERCLAMADTFDNIWMPLYPFGPPAHENCRCYCRWLQHASTGPPAIGQGDGTRAGFDNRVVVPFQRQIDRLRRQQRHLPLG